jgi:hypothetical protein
MEGDSLNPSRQNLRIKSIPIPTPKKNRFAPIHCRNHGYPTSGRTTTRPQHLGGIIHYIAKLDIFLLQNQVLFSRIKEETGVG